MKQYKLYFTMLLMMLTSITAIANTSIDTLFCEDQICAPGKNISIPVKMTNSNEIVAVQFDITLPFYVNPSSFVLGERKYDHTMSVVHRYFNNYFSTYRVIVYSAGNKSIRGNNGNLITIPLSLPDTSTVGGSYQIKLSNVIMTDVQGNNLASTGGTSRVTVLNVPHPDIAVSQVNISALSYAPGGKLSASWMVTNVGDSLFSKGWKETITLVPSMGESCVVGTSYHHGNLVAGASVSRQNDFILPKILGFDGNFNVEVRATPYANSGEWPTLAANNSALSAQTAAMDNKISFELPTVPLSENNSKSLACQLFRSGNRQASETFNLSSSDSKRLKVPTTVTLGQNCSSAYFYINVLADSTLDVDSVVTIIASGNGYSDLTGCVQIQDEDYANLTLTSSKNNINEGDVFTLTVTSDRVVKTKPLTVYLNNDNAARFTFPAQVIIPAGDSSVRVSVTAVDDDVPSLPISPEFTASAAQHRSANSILILNDNDLPEISLQLTPATISEAAGPTAIVGVLKRLTNKNTKVTVNLADDSNGGIYYSNQTLTLEKGIEEVQFSLGAIDNAIMEGERDVNITAAVYFSSCSCSASGTSAGVVSQKIHILDNDGPTLNLKSSQTMMSEGRDSAAVLTITRNTGTASAVTVNISSDHDSELTYSHTVIIPAGNSSVDIPVSVKSNTTSEGDRTVIFTAKADGFTMGTTWTMITDQTLPDATISEFTLSNTSPQAGERVTIKIKLHNGGDAVIPAQTEINMYMSSYTKPLHSVYTLYPLAVGADTILNCTLLMPNLTGKYTLNAIVNENKSFKELLYINNISPIIELSMKPRYNVFVSSDKSVYRKGETIIISGAASGNVTTNVPVDIYLINDGSKQIFKDTTDINGNFSYRFIPQPYQMGHFSVGACYPNENLSVEQSSFDIYGLRRASSEYIKCETLVGETFSGNVCLTNPGNLKLTGVKVIATSLPKGCHALFDVDEEISAGGNVTLRYTLNSDSISVGSDWDKVKVLVSTTEGASLEMTFYYYCRSPKAVLTANVSTINTTMIKGSSRDYTFTITNKGKGNTGKIHLTLPSRGWMKSVSPMDIESLNQGESAEIILRLTPTDNMQLNVPIVGQIGINCDNGIGIPLNYDIETVSESTGTLKVKVSDEYTYYTSEAPLVKDAHIIVTIPTTGKIVAQGVTDENGLYSILLPEGYYSLSVTANKHESYKNNILVDPGKINVKNVNLSCNSISVSWKVVETEVKDEYTIAAKVKYETNVPEPVVVIGGPEKVDGDAMAVGESKVLYFTLTNKGLITAQDAELLLPEPSNEWSLTALSEVGPFTLAPQQSITIPVQFTHLSNGGSKSPMKTQIRRVDNTGFTQCMAGLSDRYKWFCGSELKQNTSAFSMAFRGCFFGAIISSLMSNIGGGKGGGIGSPDGVSSPNNNGSTETPGIVIDKDKTICNPEVADAYKNILDNLGSLLPGIGNYLGILNAAADVYDEYKRNGNVSFDTMNGLTSSFGLNLDPTSDFRNMLQLLNSFNTISGGVKSDNSAKSLSFRMKKVKVTSYDWMNDFYVVSDLYQKQIEALLNIQKEIFGNPVWYNSYDDSQKRFFLKLKSLKSDYLDINDVIDNKPSYITTDILQQFVDRINNTIKKSNNPNHINIDSLMKDFNVAITIDSDAVKEGYSSMTDEFIKSYDIFSKRVTEEAHSVCSSITLQLSQTVAMTRQAFRGTLTIYNGNEEKAMTDVKLNLRVTDSDGNIATSHEFQINNEKIDTFGGELNGAWTLDALKTGIASILFIPTKYAAPRENRVYYFGGSLSYVDPYSGLTVTRDLFPVSLTVKPSPNLRFTYFMQRDIYGDDALTPDVVEPSVPAEFSLLINNEGYGDATNVNITTQQPKITENLKGLMIDFKLLSSQLNGGEQSLALDSDVVTNFGTIPTHGSSYAQWWMTSSLLGHFTEYNVKATHVTSYDNPNLTLLDTVTIHELIRSLEVNKKAAFLVNDITDADDTPDRIYMTDGAIYDVVSANASSTKVDNMKYIIHVSPSKQNSWCYGSIFDPTNGRQSIQSIIRNSDGAVISLRNFWQTDRILRDGQDPLYENRIHFADSISSDADSYTVTFTERPDVILAVDAFSGLDEQKSVQTISVKNVTVKFNKPINPSTFTAADMTLRCQGVPVDISSVVPTTTDNMTFDVPLSGLTNSNGYYVLTVNTSCVTDTEGYQGEIGTSYSWTYYKDGNVYLTTTIFPEKSGTVIGASADAKYCSTQTLTAVSNTGYEFAGWYENNLLLSTSSVLPVQMISSRIISAKFRLRKYNIMINATNGTTNVGTGVYEYNTVLSLKASPSDGYRFKSWMCGPQVIASTTDFDFTVTDTATLTAVFESEKIIKLYIPVSKGWNWISSNISDERLKTPSNFMAPVIGNASRLVGLHDEFVKDENSAWSGSLSVIDPTSYYKLLTDASGDISLTGYRYEPSSETKTLEKGWNWMGYIPSVNLTVSTALSNLLPTADDEIVGQEGLCTYVDDKWVGTLKLMKPGRGYLYYSHSLTSFNYPLITAAESVSDADTTTSTPIWSVDSHAYQDVMPLIAYVYNNGERADMTHLTVGAFCGDDCRGVGECIDGHVFMNIHGHAEDKIIFKVVDSSNGVIRNVVESESFETKMLGTYASPYSLNLGSATSVLHVGSGMIVYPNPVQTKLYLQGDVQAIKRISIHTLGGATILQHSSYSVYSGIDVSSLMDGCYLICIDTDNQSYNMKFVKQGK